MPGIGSIVTKYTENSTFTNIYCEAAHRSVKTRIILMNFNYWIWNFLSSYFLPFFTKFKNWYRWKPPASGALGSPGREPIESSFAQAGSNLGHFCPLGNTSVHPSLSVGGLIHSSASISSCPVYRRRPTSDPAISIITPCLFTLVRLKLRPIPCRVKYEPRFKSRDRLRGTCRTEDQRSLPLWNLGSMMQNNNDLGDSMNASWLPCSSTINIIFAVSHLHPLECLSKPRWMGISSPSDCSSRHL